MSVFAKDASTFEKKSNRLLCTTSRTAIILYLSSQAVSPALSQQATVDEIIVSAQKRDQNMQSVPISLQAVGSGKLEDLGVTNFDEVANLLPSVSVSTLGPGNAQVYMRGISDGGDGNYSGSNPSVAIYLDDQPVTSTGRILDVHMYDIERVEALAGPQGTLYGASSQAGTIKIITKKPDPSGFSAGFDIGLADTEKGDVSYAMEGFVNVPLSDRVTARLALHAIRDGGYIDSVAATRAFNPAAAGTRYDGPVISNDAYVEEDFNEEKNRGMRAALKIDLNDNWTANLRTTHQKQETTGVWDHDPEDVGDLQVERFFEDSGEDEYTQHAVSLEGGIGGVSVNYAGSYLDRDVSYHNDYSEYVNFSDYIGYYTCYYEAGGVCRDPRIQYVQRSKYKTDSHELRVQTDEQNRMRLIAGLFYQKAEHKYLNLWQIPDISSGMDANNNSTGLLTGYPADTYFLTDQERVDEERAVFGEFSMDLSDRLSATLGMRDFETETKLSGFVGTIYSGSPAVNVKTDEGGQIYKFNASYNASDGVMVYATYSEGFRAGGVNRRAGVTIPIAYSSDLVKNREIGWKSTVLDGSLRLNGALFQMDWVDIQFTRFDPSEANIGLTSNAGEGEVEGLEFDFAWAASDNLRIDGALSHIPTAELTETFQRNDGSRIFAPAGTRLPFVPEWKANISARYNYTVSNYNGFAQVSAYYTDETYNDLYVDDRALQDGYSYADVSVGVDEETWSASLYINNVNDERADLYRNSTDYDSRITTNRPRTIGLRFAKRF